MRPLLLDVDGVVANIAKKVYYYLKKKGKEWDFRSYDIPEVPWEDPGFYVDLEPYPTSVQFLSQYYDLVPIYFATNRRIPGHFTKTWFRERLGIDPRLYLVKNLKAKYLLAQELDALVLVDDKPKHFEPSPITRIIVNRPYNREIEIVKEFDSGSGKLFRINSLLELGKILETWKGGRNEAPNFSIGRSDIGQAYL